MLAARIETLSDGRTERYRIEFAGDVLSYGEVIECWCRDEALRTFFVKLLSDAPFTAYRWETPPVTAATLNRDFEFVLLDSPRLVRAPDEMSFTQQFHAKANKETVVVFPNIGMDAMLVVPCPDDQVNQPIAAEHYVHLGAFVRHGPPRQVDEFWQAVGRSMREHVNDEPTWLSTAGMGVAWLHVRLDRRPKYYAHRAYRDEA